MFFAKPNRFRFVYKLGQDKKVIVSDGKKVWTYLSEEGQVRIIAPRTSRIGPLGSRSGGPSS